MSGLVSIITPTMPDRLGVLQERCLPSVVKQTYEGPIEHILVTEENLFLDEVHFRRDQERKIRVLEMGNCWKTKVIDRNHGARSAWLWFMGTQIAKGDYIGFLGDDDEYLPEHVEKHVKALQQPGVDFTTSIVEFRVKGERVMDIGDGRIKTTHVDSDAIMARKECFLKANWQTTDSGAPDYELVLAWHNKGCIGGFIPEVTAIHHDGWLARRPDIIRAAKAGRDWRAAIGLE